MAQHDYVIANGTGAAVRSDINNGLAAIVSNNSGATEPATMYAYQWWADTTTGLLKIRNAANNGWVTVGTLASANLGLLASAGTLTAALGSASTPGITFTGDTNTGIYSPGADQVAVATSGTGRLFVDASGNVGLGTSAASTTLDIRSASTVSDSTRYNLLLVDSSSYASGVGGGINFGYKFNAAGNVLQRAASIGVRKENGTDGNYASALTFHTTADASLSVEAMRIDSSGRVGIGTASPGALLHAAGKIRFGSNASYYGEIDHDAASTGSNIYNHSDSGGHIFQNGGTERLRIDSSGRLLVGTSTASFSTTVKLQANSGSATGESRIRFCRGEATPANGATLGIVGFSDNTETPSAEIAAQRDGGTWSASSVPGRLVFSTTADGASSPTERVRITEKGEFQMGNSSQGSNNILRQIARDAGNSSETFTAANMGMSDNITALINISIGGTSSNNEYGGCLIYWYMPRGTSSAIQQTIVAAFKGSGIATFSVAASGNDLVVTKDSDVGVFVTVIGGGGISIF